MKITKDREMEVMGVHNLFWESYAHRDIELRFSLCSEDVTFIGSGLHERALNKTEYKNINKEGVKQFPDPFQIEFLWTNLSMLNEFVACVESEVVWSQMINSEISTELLRNTTLLKYDNTKWLVTHVHGSVPDYRLKEGDYMTNEQTIIRNRELERQVFERTQDLNKTLEELEQKNRELEIEGTLEKVRTIAMGMRKPADMLDVCKTISLQLQLLGVKEIRNVQTAIFYEQRGTYMNYEFYAKHDKNLITETVFTNNEIHNEFATKMLKGKGETFITHIKGDKVKEWIEYQKTTNVFIDKYLETASSLNYYWFSLGPVALGISTYHPLVEEQINLFKRFLKVFELAYQRYLDIEIAEAQAREAQIEVSLERVRAVAMGMNKSDDLLSICEVSFKEFKKLGFDNIRNALIHIQYDNQKYFMDYDFSDLTGGAITKIEYGSHPVVEDYLKQIRSAKDAFYQGVIEEDQLEEWKDFRRNSGQIDDPRLDKATALYYYFFSIGIGDIGISTLKSIDESQIKILNRFRNVFNLSYQRYIDITLAETQAREAKIEAALEKVRGRAMAMRSSEDLGATVNVFFKELKNLGFLPRRCGVAIIDEARRSAYNMITTAGNIGDSFEITGDVNLDSHFVLTNMLLNWKVQQDYFLELDTEQIEEYYRILRPQVAVTNFNDARQYGYYLHFKEGMFYVWMDKELQVNDLQIFRRFTQVIGLTYRRHLDLQKAETQAREAQIETALERVRSRTMGMQKSEELKEVIRVVYEQFVHLKIKIDHAGFVVDYTPKGDWHFWIADEQDIPSKITHPYFESVWANQFNEAKEKGADFFATNLNFEEKNKFYNELLSYIPELPEASKHFYLSCPGLAATTVLFDNVSLYIENFSSIPYSDEENKILMRFGKVFQQTYTRFLDLQRAEAQNKIIQAENDRKTKELEEARQLQLSMLPKKLPQLPNLDIAVYMKTATEVGGDYYDFNIDGNGTLTVVVGDATGHGMMSGMMVSIMKSFFISNRNSIDLKQFFENTNNSLKEMQLGRLMMPLIGVQINSDRLIATNAGMPSLLYFRNKSQKAGEFVSNNLPLGGMKGTQYILKEIRYEIGDTLLLMSDGFAELKNKKNEQYGYKRIISEFKSVAQKSSNEIVEYLKNSASKWMNGIEPDDDISFVVIKIKQ